jgi:large subunit ribosomal protein L13
MKIIFDAENAIVGRLGSVVAKELLRGNEVVVVNSEKAILSGNKKRSVERIMDLRKKGGSSQKGPKISKLPDRLLKRMIRGMLPWDRPRGREVYKSNLRCYVSVPTEIKQEELKNARKVSVKKPIKFTTIKQISEAL